MSADKRGLELLALKGIMTTKDGRSVVARLIELAGTHSDTFSADPYTHAYKAGKRSQGVWLENEVKTHFNGSYLLMLKESQDE
jgi:hypothetical protein|tara:strand:+ start:915 stop:1163 length:249 start_codon:yes stop_codon:yes gene_type:complete